MYDPATKKLTHIATCFGTHHLMFAEDANNTLWTSGGGQVVGWLNRKMFDETGDEEKSQGWTALIMDTNGNGKRDAYVEPDQPVDPTKDKRFGAAFYSVAPAPDGSVWGTVLGYPGQVVRLVPGSNPPETALAEVYEPPFNDKVRPGFSPRGGDVDRNGVFWAALASGHLASFDRRKCKGPLNGPKATGQHCPEGWTLYTEPAPQFRGVKDGGSVEGSYYTWVDQFDTLGLGANTPINTGNASEGLLALKDGKWVVLRVPYPTGFYTKWMDGRIDDPKGGWKGRGLWATISTRTPFHMETGKGTTSKVLSRAAAAGSAGEMMRSRHQARQRRDGSALRCCSSLPSATLPRSTARPTASGARGAATSASPATRRSIRSTPRTSTSCRWRGASRPTTSAPAPTSTCRPRR